VNTGNLTFACSARDGSFWTSITAALYWRFLPESIEDVVRGIDVIWGHGGFSVLYAYDYDDFRLQNTTAVPGMEHSGLIREQVDFVKRFGVVEEIDTRANPGFFVNSEGLFWSIQWLNYWSAEAQRRMFGGLLENLTDEVQRTSLEAGAVRVRLLDRPGRFDDVQFHQRQLRFRHQFPFRDIMGSARHLATSWGQVLNSE
jgi:hypothetical protein